MKPEWGGSPSGPVQYGTLLTTREVMEEIRKDEIFYYHSSGGVTLSGGDILCQPEFTSALLKSCKKDMLHTAAELNMYGDAARILSILPYLDEVYADIKIMDSHKHRKYTGVDSSGILQNIRCAAGCLPPGALHIRVPLIPGINDDKENLRATAEFCRTLGNAVKDLEFLPYHRLGEATYQALNRKYPLAGLPALTKKAACEKIAFLREPGYPFPVLVSGSIIINHHERRNRKHVKRVY